MSGLDLLMLEFLPQNCGKKIRSNKNQAVNLQTNKRKMRQRTRYFLVVLLLMFAGNIFSQVNSNSNGHPYVKNYIKIFSLRDKFLSSYTFSSKFKKEIVVTQSFSHFNLYKGRERILTPVFSFLSPVAKDFSTNQLGIVCKKEFEFEKKTSIPLRLRIGSLDYTNYMEQKPNALKPQ